MDLFVSAPTQYIEVDGVSFAYRRFGKLGGVPVVGFQHFTGTLDNWDPIIMNGLAKQREVIVFDNKGVGNSGGVTPDSVYAMTQDAIRFIEQLGITQMDVLGFSLGGFIAQQLAVLRPALIRKIMIVGAAPQGAKALHSFPDLIQRAMQLAPAERFLFIFFTPTEASREKGRAALARLQWRVEDRDKATSDAAVMAQLKAITAWGTDAVSIDVTRIKHPVLVVQGSNDDMMDSSSSYTLFQQLPNALLSCYPDAAHGSFFQYPHLFVHEALYFLDHY
ncbi:Pimeloyl-ACP methyl ester carboxylesterase [Filimonas lacunae]|uniref:Pimeloyl-ACP methyl ester carboxylesterase n=1 Tax=Filimonas lacunae TaxID=477680 RepID=A0A173MH35_9BACT|nr:alpha/beta hydrolase [Filimonas lacunae]BAV06934.1 hydrolase, alpha/beta hydrolase fold family [Filimonas lacunae]SIS97599.1 Pimeloyl-ACP methyl ester carboxylesterase [Filimonas lacunae]